MVENELLELVKAGRYDDFELRCLEMLEEGRLELRCLVRPFDELERAGQTARLLTLGQMVLEAIPPESDPPAALSLYRLMLVAAPQDERLRDGTVTLYRQVHGGAPGFELILEASGLAGGRPVRTALGLLDLCLNLQAGDPLICRSDGRVVEVVEIDRLKWLFTLRREGRLVTLPATEVGRDYERIAADDFRVLRQLRPERIAALIESDPVAVVIGLLRTHGQQIDADELKHELVPRFIAAQQWARWWTRTRGLLKRCQNVAVEGRAPVILRYVAQGRCLEDEIWAVLEDQKDPLQWLDTLEGYLREKAAHKEAADPALLRRFEERVQQEIAAVRRRRPAEALTCALVLRRLEARGLQTSEAVRTLPETLLAEAEQPGVLLREVGHDALRELGLQALQAARPSDWPAHALSWLPTATASLLDKLVPAACEAGCGAEVQSFVDAGLADPLRHPELLYWLWKGPSQVVGLRLPARAELFRLILDTLSELGRTLTAADEVKRAFRQRMKAALALHDYEGVRQCLAQTSEEAAVTIRQQLQRLEGLGPNAPARMLDLLRDVHPRLWVVQPKQVAPWEERETIWCTSEGLRRRTAERDEIVNVRMPENARRIGEAAAHGDLSENSEYKFALEERDLLRARVAKINDELSRARTISKHDVPSDHVGIGSRVTLRAVADGSRRTMTFLGPFETDIERGIYSYLAPVSQKLLGARVGDHVTITTDGRDVEFEVVAIDNALADSVEAAAGDA